MAVISGWMRAALIAGASLSAAACMTYPSEPRYSTHASPAPAPDRGVYPSAGGQQSAYPGGAQTQPYRANQPPAPQDFPAPALQTDPRGDLARFLAEQREGLEGYGWVDRAQGLVRIPVRRAMEIQAGRGMDAYAPLEAPEPGVPLPVRPEAARRGEAGP